LKTRPRKIILEGNLFFGANSPKTRPGWLKRVHYSEVEPFLIKLA